MRIQLTLLLCLSIIISGCDTDFMNPTPTNSEKKIYEGDYSHDLELLSKFMVIPKKPLEVTWAIDEEQTSPQRESGSLSALLKFKPQDYEDIVKDSEKLSLTESIISIEEFNWLPTSTANQYQTVKSGDNIEVQSIQVIKQIQFVDPETLPSPYVNGRAILFNDGFILVRLYVF